MNNVLGDGRSPPPQLHALCISSLPVRGVWQRRAAACCGVLLPPPSLGSVLLCHPPLINPRQPAADDASDGPVPVGEGGSEEGGGERRGAGWSFHPSTLLLHLVCGRSTHSQVGCFLPQSGHEAAGRVGPTGGELTEQTGIYSHSSCLQHVNS